MLSSFMESCSEQQILRENIDSCFTIFYKQLYSVDKIILKKQTPAQNGMWNVLLDQLLLIFLCNDYFKSKLILC